jgi:hypothetical protein
MQEFVQHLEYLADYIRHTIWERDKYFLIAKEQNLHGREYLDKYNLGYYPVGIAKEVIVSIANNKEIREPETIDLEAIIKQLSKKQDIKNIEEFIMEFEKQLIEVILRHGKV